ncbi:MAG TPA: hypothetical protein VF346_09230 [Bacteroidales bacterium]
MDTIHLNDSNRWMVYTKRGMKFNDAKAERFENRFGQSNFA